MFLSQTHLRQNARWGTSDRRRARVRAPSSDSENSDREKIVQGPRRRGSPDLLSATGVEHFQGLHPGLPNSPDENWGSNEQFPRPTLTPHPLTRKSSRNIAPSQTPRDGCASAPFDCGLEFRLRRSGIRIIILIDLCVYMYIYIYMHYDIHMYTYIYIYIYIDIHM